ncbi:hypothetical protein HD806DRAFT_505814 [Xylariaceae sp. AK1471]|nr:hypothetical protein HD806DRAFT_505814 [Xylariaceae sp. AK1471]
MSILNIIGTLLNQDYPAIFLVRTPVMSEAERDPEEGFFAAEVLFEAAEDQSRKARFPRLSDENVVPNRPINSLCILIGSIPLAITGFLSGFQTQSSTSLQRGFTMSWLVLGIVIGTGLPIIYDDLSYMIMRAGSFGFGPHLGIDMRFFACLIYGIAAIGGMIVVGQMIRDYGVCTLLT